MQTDIIIATLLGVILLALFFIILNQRQMALSQSELAQELKNVTAQNEKSRVEILAKIKALEDALAAGGGTTPEVDEALAELKASVQVDDDIVPDEPPV